MIYLDSSALLKRVRREAETDALGAWLSERPEAPLVTSEVGRVEVIRAARRIGGHVVPAARAVVDDLDLVPLHRTVQDIACELEGPGLRTLDALHLASALVLGDELTVVVAYDRRRLAAATAVGLPVESPA